MTKQMAFEIVKEKPSTLVSIRGDKYWWTSTGKNEITIYRTKDNLTNDMVYIGKMPTKNTTVLKLGTRVKCSWGIGYVRSTDGRGSYEIMLDACRWVFGKWTCRVGDMRRDIQVIA